MLIPVSLYILISLCTSVPTSRPCGKNSPNFPRRGEGWERMYTGYILINRQPAHSFLFLIRLMEISKREEEEMKKAINISVSSDRESLEKEKLLKEDKKSPTIKQTECSAKPKPQHVTAEKLPTINKPQQSVSKASTKSTSAADAAASWIKDAREEAASTSSSRTTPVS